MSVVQLPMAESPVVGLQCLAYTLNILLNDEGSLPWFHSNYIQLMMRSDNILTFYPSWFTENPLLDVQFFKKETIKDNNIDMHSFIVNCIDHQTYFYSSFDEYYVSKRFYYGRRHFCHDFMIYGYDAAQKEYLLFGYNDKWFIEKTRISFEQFDEAFFSDTAMMETIHLLKKKEQVRYDFDLQLVYEMLGDYLNSRNTSEMARMRGAILTNRAWGLDVYKRLGEYFNLLISGEVRYDIRPLHILYEHKKCMVSRLEYMYKNDYINDYSYLYDNYKSILNKSIVMRNLQLKYSTTRDKQHLSSILNILVEIEQKEKELLEILIDKIRIRL